jgi:dCMP deaminase
MTLSLSTLLPVYTNQVIFLTPNQPRAGLVDLSLSPPEDDHSPDALHDAIPNEDYLHMAQKLSGWHEDEDRPAVLTPPREFNVTMQ